MLVRSCAPVTIADPLHRDRAVVALTIHDASLSTSSGSEKSFVVNGRRFTHILDPRTGEALPPRGSVSVIARNATEADILSTALYVMGRDEGLRWANEHAVAALPLRRNLEAELPIVELHHGDRTRAAARAGELAHQRARP